MQKVQELKSRLDEALRNLRNKLESKNVNVEIKSACTLVQKSIELYTVNQ